MSGTASWVSVSIPREKKRVQNLSQTEDEVDMYVQKFNWRQTGESSAEPEGQLVVEFKHKSYTYNSSTFEIHIYDSVPQTIYELLVDAVDDEQSLEPLIKSQLVENNAIPSPHIK